MEVAAIFIVVIGAVVLLRLAAGQMDGGRIDEYIRSEGGHILERHWTPFGRGWFGDRDMRIYEVRYVDREGNVHDATCKTSMWGGVYFTEDTVSGGVRGAGKDSAAQTLLEENRRLREELERLKYERR